MHVICDHNNLRFDTQAQIRAGMTQQNSSDVEGDFDAEAPDTER